MLRLGGTERATASPDKGRGGLSLRSLSKGTLAIKER